MKVLLIGDICGRLGCEALLKKLPDFKKNNNIDLVIANGENASEGNGILPASAEILFASGIDVITGGNHTIRRMEIFPMLEENPFLLRPANLPDSLPGSGYVLVDLGYITVAVINILGVVYTENADCPFRSADKLIEQAKQDGAALIFVDFHAEATSEKRALGFYLDGRATCVFGTHTHVQTADEQLLPEGTAYITDIGMTGVKQSVLGVEKEIILKRMRDKLPIRFQNAVGEVEINGCIVSIDKKKRTATSIERVSILCGKC